MEIETDENNVITDVHFVGGCNGNTKGVSALVKGMNARDVIDRLEGIQCGFKGTSCPDQLAKALRQMLRTAE
ncbi:MAG: TIGR03905 family TSCPD domain-containing protein [Clostridia bacterium]|nr:TIGR03905 family TSCPD domain-containing protein [Clostridia bacterium]